MQKADELPLGPLGKMSHLPPETGPLAFSFTLPVT